MQLFGCLCRCASGGGDRWADRFTEMGEDLADGGGVGEEGDDAHLRRAEGTWQRKRFMDAREQLHPGVASGTPDPGTIETLAGRAAGACRRDRFGCLLSAVCRKREVRTLFSPQWSTAANNCRFPFWPSAVRRSRCSHRGTSS